MHLGILYQTKFFLRQLSYWKTRSEPLGIELVIDKMRNLITVKIILELCSVP